jgi:hypothetical protein
MDRSSQRNFICRSLLSKMFHRFKFGAIQTVQFSLMRQSKRETFNSPKYPNQNRWGKLMFWACVRRRNRQICQYRWRISDRDVK